MLLNKNAQSPTSKSTATKLPANTVLTQCNTKYTGNGENVNHVNLNVLKTYATLYPRATLGLSQHTRDYVDVLGAVALGARVIEKHFTDRNSGVGPDHNFATTPGTWIHMVREVRQLEKALGSPVKRVCENEKEARIVQRRALWDGKPLRPCPPDREGELGG